MLSRAVLVLFVFVAVVAARPSVARAEFSAGEVPAGVNAFIEHRHDLRLSVLGASALAVTDHTELSSYLLADLILIPNLRVEHQFVNTGDLAISATVGIAAGMFPLVGGTAIPLPGGAVGGAGIGFAWGTIQSGSLIGTVRLTPTVSLSANGGGFAVEGGLAGVVAGVGVGGNGAAANAAPASVSGVRFGGTAGVELSSTFGKRDAVVIACDGWFFKPFAMDGASGILYARAAWTHQWGRFQLTTGVYGFADPPSWKMLRSSKLPVAPFANVGWVL